MNYFLSNTYHTYVTTVHPNNKIGVFIQLEEYTISIKYKASLNQINQLVCNKNALVGDESQLNRN